MTSVRSRPIHVLTILLSHGKLKCFMFRPPTGSRPPALFNSISLFLPLSTQLIASFSRFPFFFLVPPPPLQCQCSSSQWACKFLFRFIRFYTGCKKSATGYAFSDSPAIKRKRVIRCGAKRFQLDYLSSELPLFCVYLSVFALTITTRNSMKLSLQMRLTIRYMKFLNDIGIRFKIANIKLLVRAFKQFSDFKTHMTVYLYQLKVCLQRQRKMYSNSLSSKIVLLQIDFSTVLTYKTLLN